MGKGKNFTGDDLMLAGECLYTPLRNIKTFWEYQTFLALDGGLTLLEESIADSFMVASFS